MQRERHSCVNQQYIRSNKLTISHCKSSDTARQTGEFFEGILGSLQQKHKKAPMVLHVGDFLSPFDGKTDDLTTDYSPLYRFASHVTIWETAYFLLLGDAPLYKPYRWVLNNSFVYSYRHYKAGYLYQWKAAFHWCISSRFFETDLAMIWVKGVKKQVFWAR